MEHYVSTNLILECICQDFDGIRFLVNQKVDVNQVDSYGFSPLHTICVTDCDCDGDERVDIVNYLIQHRADVNQKNKEGWTPLMSATMNGYLKIVQFLPKITQT